MDQINFFRDADINPIRIRANNENYIYFSIPYNLLKAYGAHFVRGDKLVVNFVATSLSDDA